VVKNKMPEKIIPISLIQKFESVGFSIVNKGGVFRKDLMEGHFDLSILNSCVDLAIEDLQQIKRILLNSEFEIIVNKRGN